eukprot:scaffold15043_cov23-Tisochrysis_lutea.AAC.1
MLCGIAARHMDRSMYHISMPRGQSTCAHHSVIHMPGRASERTDKVMPDIAQLPLVTKQDPI